MGAREDFVEEACHFFFSLVIYFSLKEQEFPFLVWVFFFPNAFLANFQRNAVEFVFLRSF